MATLSHSADHKEARAGRHHAVAPGLEVRIRAEFEEMHGLRLSQAQAARLFGLDHATCGRVLESLSSKGFLKKDAHGRYCWAQLDV